MTGLELAVNHRARSGVPVLTRIRTGDLPSAIPRYSAGQAGWSDIYDRSTNPVNGLLGRIRKPKMFSKAELTYFGKK